MSGYYRHATRADILALARESGSMLVAVFTLSEKRLNAVQARVEAVHARIRRRKAQAERTA